MVWLWVMQTAKSFVGWCFQIKCSLKTPKFSPTFPVLYCKIFLHTSSNKSEENSFLQILPYWHPDLSSMVKPGRQHSYSFQFILFQWIKFLNKSTLSTPPPLYQGEGMNLRVCPKVNILLFICLWQWKKAFIHYAINPICSWPSFMGTSPHWGVPPGFGGLHHYEAMVLLSCCLLVTIKILTEARNILFHS